jgi:tetratricopeptide (TPR) repeat protein
MAKLIGILLGLALTVTSAVLLWRAEPPPLQEQAFGKLAEATPSSIAEAIRLYQQALTADPLSPYRWCDLAEAWIEASQTGEARSCMRRAQELGPNIPQVWVRAANSYFRLDDPAEALRAAAAVLRMTPAYDAILFRYFGQFIPIPVRSSPAWPETGAPPRPISATHCLPARFPPPIPPGPGCARTPTPATSSPPNILTP